MAKTVVPHTCIFIISFLPFSLIFTYFHCFIFRFLLIFFSVEILNVQMKTQKLLESLPLECRRSLAAEKNSLVKCVVLLNYATCRKLCLSLMFLSETKSPSQTGCKNVWVTFVYKQSATKSDQIVVLPSLFSPLPQKKYYWP